MKKIFVVAVLLGAILLQFCSPSNKIAKAPPAPPKFTYEANVKALVAAKCAPCHIPPQGNKEPLNTFAGAVKNIDQMLRRTQLNPGERGFMPQRNPKLSEADIHVLAQWKADGLLEK